MGFYGTKTKFKGQPSDTSFFVPPTLQGDYDNLLHTDVPNHTYNAVLNGETIRCAFQAKGRNGEGLLRVGVEVKIETGDMIEIGNMGPHLIVSVEPAPNCKTCATLKINARITIKRHVPRQADSLGRVIREAGEISVCEKLLAALHMETAQENAPAANAPGVYPESYVVGQVSFNEQTRAICIGDEFLWGDSVYRIVNVDWTEVDIFETHGLLRLTCQRKAGSESQFSAGVKAGAGA